MKIDPQERGVYEAKRRERGAKMPYYPSLNQWDERSRKQRAFLQAMDEAVHRHEKAAKAAQITPEVRVIGAGIYEVNTTAFEPGEVWKKCVQEAAKKTGYTPRWHNTEPTDMEPVGLEPIEPEETRYTEEYKKQLAESQIPVIQEMEIQRGKKIIRVPVGAWEEYLEEKEKRYAETLERHQKLFSELLKKRR